MNTVTVMIRKEWVSINEEMPGAILKNFASLLSRLISISYAMAISRWYLRSCDKGSFVLTRGKPKVINQGKITLGDKVRIWSTVNQVRLSVGKNATLTVGSNTRINGSTISANNSITIGNNCRIAPFVILMDSDFHDTGNREAAGECRPIVIEDNAWLATRSFVLKGVTVGKGAVVAAGSVVTKDVPPYTVVAGVPAKIVKHLPNPDLAVR